MPGSPSRRGLHRLSFCLTLCLLILGLANPKGLWAQSGNSEDFPPVLRTGERTPARADLQDLNWIAGHWYGQALGGRCEEIWSEPRDGSMMGMFRLSGAGEVQFYELMTITSEQDQVLLRIRHFSDRLRAWEEQDKPLVFPLLNLEPGTAYLEGITFSQIGADGLLIQVRFDADGPREEVVRFPYRRYTPGKE
jgi:hypothetical protein